ncbi:hypothetical protein JOL62DRAFT_588953 [Phyllosticta paracitricarpa]|uniref:Uncharacterized protein n=2 Tax=Phyllosticta TaxID=121621 RepID=A0ABR1LDM1_9PEZI
MWLVGLLVMRQVPLGIAGTVGAVCGALQCRIPTYPPNVWTVALVHLSSSHCLTNFLYRRGGGLREAFSINLGSMAVAHAQGLISAMREADTSVACRQ